METSHTARDQGRLRADMDTVRAYGVEHPEDWADVRWVNEPVVTIVIRFVDHLEEHRASLEQLVANPDRLRVEPAQYTATHLEQVGQEIIDSARQDHSLRSCGPRDGRFRCHLRGGAIALAEEFHRRYGDMVDLTVGVLPYPPTGSPHAPPGEPPVSDGSLPADVELVLDESRLPSGADGTARLRITNRGSTGFDVMTGVMCGWVYRPGEDRPVSACNGWRTLQGINVRLAPGESSIEVPVLFSTDSYDPAVGYALPPGPYEVLGVLDYTLNRPSAGPPTDHHCIRSSRALLTLT